MLYYAITYQFRIYFSVETSGSFVFFSTRRVCVYKSGNVIKTYVLKRILLKDHLEYLNSNLTLC